MLDQSGTVLLTVEGLRLAGGTSEQQQADRLLNERLLTIDWEPRELPEATRGEPGSWPLLDACDGTDPLAAQLAEALKSDGAQCTAVSLPLAPVDAAQLRSLLTGGGQDTSNGHGRLKGLSGVVVPTAQQADGSDGICEPLRARDYGRTSWRSPVNSPS